MAHQRSSAPSGPSFRQVIVRFYFAAACLSSVSAFQLHFAPRSSPPSTRLNGARGTVVQETEFDPLGIAKEVDESPEFDRWDQPRQHPMTLKDASVDAAGGAQMLSLGSLALLTPEPAKALEPLNLADPASFQPVCPASDGFYRVLRSTAESIVGAESAKEYGPLIAGGLLRVRLELCVVESFFNEAVGPFIAKNGLSWVLPLHETVETFIAGTVFAVTATFILIGSTKIITVAFTYTDFLLGIPSRVLGNFFYDRALGKPVTLDVGFGPFKTRLIGPPAEEEIRVDLSQQGPAALAVIVISGIVKLFGQALGVLREVFDTVDLFVGRYLVVWATGYVLFKFVHFKVFPNFPF